MYRKRPRTCGGQVVVVKPLCVVNSLYGGGGGGGDGCGGALFKVTTSHAFIKGAALRNESRADH